MELLVAWRIHMRWSKTAEDAISKVPFFVRKKVRNKIEIEAQAVGASEVTLEHVQTIKQRFLNKMGEDVKGYQIDSCFGPSGCPNGIPKKNDLSELLDNILGTKNLKSFLSTKVQGSLKFHHEFRVSLSDCPNACSRPQISDIGIIAAMQPATGEGECVQCGICAEACLEKAVTLVDHVIAPVIDLSKCVCCGQCIKACPNGTIVKGQEGFRVMVSGKLGRHPRLASELTGIFSYGEVLELVDKILDVYIAHNQRGERLGEIIERMGLQKFQRMIAASLVKSP